MTSRIGSDTPITPVEATATRRSGEPDTIAPAPCILAAFSNPGRPVAALALPELTTIARRWSSSQRSVQISTGAASTPERVKRAALAGSGASHTISPTSSPPLGLIPAATPAARNRPGSPSPSSSVTCSGTSTQRERKKLN